jgi:hypothetical protein
MAQKTSSNAKSVTVEHALRRIVELSKDGSLPEELLRTQVIAYAIGALEQVEDGRTIAWLLVWADGSPEVRTKPETDRYGLKSSIPLSFVPNGDIVAWRWGDGGGYNADYRYSFVDPLEDWEEVEAQGASSVIGCRPLYQALLPDVAAG